MCCKTYRETGGHKAIILPKKEARWGYHRADIYFGDMTKPPKMED